MNAQQNTDGSFDGSTCIFLVANEGIAYLDNLRMLWKQFFTSQQFDLHCCINKELHAKFHTFLNYASLNHGSLKDSRCRKMN